MAWPPKYDRLLNRIPYPPPERSVTSIKIKPNSHGFTHQILLRHEPGCVVFVLKAAILAVIAIVAHEEIMTGGHHPFAGLDAAVGKHDEVALGTELLDGRGSID